MKKINKKLNLNRETIATLQDNELEAINGGISPLTTVTTSSGPCTASIASVLSAVSMSLKSRGPGC
ncbi:MAG: class IIb bacteriocin, lactobin A/cerein 7B family [Kofleriaceae bacterium]